MAEESLFTSRHILPTMILPVAVTKAWHSLPLPLADSIQIFGRTIVKEVGGSLGTDFEEAMLGEGLS